MSGDAFHHPAIRLHEQMIRDDAPPRGGTLGPPPFTQQQAQAVMIDIANWFTSVATTLGGPVTTAVGNWLRDPANAGAAGRLQTVMYGASPSITLAATPVRVGARA